MLDDEAIAKLKQEHGDDLVMMTHKGTVLVFKKPSKPVWQRFITAVRDDGKNDALALDQLCIACAVQPEAKEMSAIFAESPALPDKMAKHLQILAGADDDEQVVKL